MNTSRNPQRLQIIIAFIVLYVVWGSTYLGIKIAIETIPPLVMAGARFVPAGLILFGLAIWKYDKRLPNRKDCWNACLVGLALILGGNGLVTIAEQSVDSTLAAVMLASNPIFMTIFATTAKVQNKPGIWGVLSLAIGFVGVCLLVYSSVGIELSGSLSGILLVLGAVIFWSLGAIYSKANPTTCSPFMAAGMQMCFGGLICLLVGLALGEARGFEFSAVSLRSWVAYVYLLFVGAVVGFTAFVFLLKHCSPSAVSSHAYVNPVVALILGALVLGETFNWLGWVSSAIILLAVFVLIQQNRLDKKTA
ncbi:EamA family transporter [Puniceicoccaceae bacterium K14]|nr:EamA family transporter [Puniceicoccaceae bacterium K14]